MRLYVVDYLRSIGGDSGLEKADVQCIGFRLLEPRAHSVFTPHIKRNCYKTINLDRSSFASDLDDNLRRSKTLNYNLVPYTPLPESTQFRTIYHHLHQYDFCPQIYNKIMKIWKTCTAKIGINITYSWTSIPPVEYIHSNLSSYLTPILTNTEHASTLFCV